MASAPPLPMLPYGSPPIEMIEVEVALEPGKPPTRVAVPASTPDEAQQLLHDIGNGLPAGVAYGSVLEPIRKGYKRQLEAVELLIKQKRAALGSNPTEYELRGLAQWGARQRAMTARLWRLPLPLTGVGLEARDWRLYGAGGRTFENIMARNASKGRVGTQAYEYILGSATRSNPEFNASVARGARLLRGGGAVLGVAGLSISAYDIWQTAPGQRLQVAERHGVGFAGGLVGAEVAGGLLAIGAGLLLATPPGWIVIGVGLVGGIAGSMIADRVFYPKEYQPAADQFRAGMVVDPQNPYRKITRPVGIGNTTLPVVEQITLVVRSGDTPATLIRRANLQAAASVGLLPAQQSAFADRQGSTSGLTWISGDPTPHNDHAMRPTDLAVTAGKPIVFKLSPSQRSELAALAPH